MTHGESEATDRHLNYGIPTILTASLYYPDPPGLTTLTPSSACRSHMSAWTMRRGGGNRLIRGRGKWIVPGPEDRSWDTRSVAQNAHPQGPYHLDGFRQAEAKLSRGPFVQAANDFFERYLMHLQPLTKRVLPVPI